MSTGTLDLQRVDEARRRFEGEDPETVAHRIVEEVLAAEAALESRTDEDHEDRPVEPAPSRVRRDLVLLSGDEPLALIPGPVYEPGPGAYVPPADTLTALVDDAVSTVRTYPRTISGALRSAADSPAMPATRWMLLGLLWMAAFAGLVPFAFATIGNALDVQVEIFGEDTQQTTIEQQPEDVTSTQNPSVEGQGG